MQQTIEVFERSLEKNLSGLRGQVKVPGIMYGQSLEESIPISIDLVSLQTIISNTKKTTTFPLILNGEARPCILRSYQCDPLHTEILHVDFQYVKPNETVKMQVPLTYTGLEHLQAKKCILEKAIIKIPVVGPVHALPEVFTIDTGRLDRGAKIFATDITLPDGVECLLPADTIVATIQ